MIAGPCEPAQANSRTSVNQLTETIPLGNQIAPYAQQESSANQNVDGAEKTKKKKILWDGWRLGVRKGTR